MNMQEMMNALQRDPKEFFRQMNVNVPDEILHDPQKIVMHLMRTGQLNGPAAQRMRPMFTDQGIR